MEKENFSNVFFGFLNIINNPWDVFHKKIKILLDILVFQICVVFMQRQYIFRYKNSKYPRKNKFSVIGLFKEPQLNWQLFLSS